LFQPVVESRIVRQAEHEVHRARRNNVPALRRVGMGVGRFVHGPDGLDKRTQCRPRQDGSRAYHHTMDSS
jgi:hypothetical protein